MNWADPSRDEVARHHYRYCLDQAASAISECRAVVQDDVVDDNHELPLIQRLIDEARAAA